MNTGCAPRSPRRVLGCFPHDDHRATAPDAAVADATRSLELANARYSGGLVSYLDVITAQEQLLANQRLATQLTGQRVITSVYLIKALGGTWENSALQTVQEKPSLRQVITP